MRKRPGREGWGGLSIIMAGSRGSLPFTIELGPN